MRSYVTHDVKLKLNLKTLHEVSHFMIKTKVRKLDTLIKISKRGYTFDWVQFKYVSSLWLMRCPLSSLRAGPRKSFSTSFVFGPTNRSPITIGIYTPSSSCPSLRSLVDFSDNSGLIQMSSSSWCFGYFSYHLPFALLLKSSEDYWDSLPLVNCYFTKIFFVFKIYG